MLEWIEQEICSKNLKDMRMIFKLKIEDIMFYWINLKISSPDINFRNKNFNKWEQIQLGSLTVKKFNKFLSTSDKKMILLPLLVKLTKLLTKSTNLKIIKMII